MEYLAVLILSYLAGSIPTGFILGKLGAGIDLRTYGSGNIGATNTLRALGLGAFAIVFAVDFLKGFLPVQLGFLWLGTPAAQVMAGWGALVGHNWSLYLRFAGGRGVVTGIGGLFAMAPVVSVVITLVTVVTILLTRYVSLGSILGAASALVIMTAAAALGLERASYLLYVVPGACVVLARHRANFQRLRRGTERHLGDPVLPQAQP
ncbi:MAG: glycerol-3-phosphate 1-O-acyltransferase PlsY [Chloroflexi bacterium]|nr:glycerol-3-phosphate 1-O-acyltransferase PlsY [Chloroflexota bacterium]